MSGAKAGALELARSNLRRRADSLLLAVENMPASRLASLESLAFGTFTLLFALAPWLVTYFTTNDGPVHVAMTIVLDKLGQPGYELTNAFYRSNVGPEPNWVTYVVLDALLKITSPYIAEKIVQSLVLISVPLAGRYALSFRGPQTWLSLAVFPFTFNQMFFLGLYNFTASLTFFFVFMGLILRSVGPMHRRGVLHWIAITLCLFLLYFSHAMAYATTMVALAAMVTFELATILLDTNSPLRARFKRTIVPLAYWGTASIPAFALFVFYFTRHSGADSWYGFGLWERIHHLFDLAILVRQFRFDPLVSHVFQLGLASAMLYSGYRRWQKTTDQTAEELGLSDALFFVFLCCIAIALAIPDVSGGGWTHYRRATLFVYFSAFLWISAFPAGNRLRVWFTVSASAVTGMLWLSMMYSQTFASAQTAELMSVAPYIRNHSTIAPIVYSWAGIEDDSDKPIVAHYQPFFQGASRLQYEGDRVVLFSYNARLDVYPVKLREEMDPHPTLYSWGNDSKKMDVYHFNIEWFERASGRQLDYIVTFGRPTEESFRLLSELVQERIKEFSFKKVYASPSGRVVLYERMATPAD
jgi:hypothetical protein